MCEVKSVTYVLLVLVFINGALCSIIDYTKPFKEPDIVAFQSIARHQISKRAICPASSECIPLGSCPILSKILDNQCVSTDKLGELSCGYQGSGLVCCPQAESNSINRVGSSSPGKFVDGVKCGQSQVEGDSYDGIGAYPWVTRVGFRNTLTNEIKFPCSGSIVSSKVVLTAAHCALAKAENYKLYLVRAGEWSTDTDIDCGEEFCGLPVQDIPISHVIVHPGYRKETYKHNIALLVLKSKIKFGVTAQPICLPESWSVTSNNGILVGWGKTAGQTGFLVKAPGQSWDAGYGSLTSGNNHETVCHCLPAPRGCPLGLDSSYATMNELTEYAKQFTETPYRQQTLFLPIVSLRQCEKVYGKTLPVSEEQICAGGDRGQDACSGFGGAPLLVQHSNVYYQVGILSFGSDQCGAAGVPSVYINIKKYITWIRENSPQVI